VLEGVPVTLSHLCGVVAGLVAPGLDPGAIYVWLAEVPQERRGCPRQSPDQVGGRHDGGEMIRSHCNALYPSTSRASTAFLLSLGNEGADSRNTPAMIGEMVERDQN